ncbi:DoxX family protein [Flavobacterium sp. TP390]|uniref:DoxX family protein n=1 Tax=Flavobacterium profundi TaxID=1774945 RepID=A0A6I4IE46_9FLAO|nr:DoxX family protein [Flavobacterium profundi]MVO07943.1 DoxX family protein [Flavobacterium profundi]
MKKTLFIWILKLVAVIILLQTLYFKFSDAPESVYIFSTLNAEPFGRIASGIIELIASILILIPRTTFLGAVLGVLTMFGAILSHLTLLGIEVQNDGGTLFVLAVLTFMACLLLVYFYKNDFVKLRQFRI